MFLIALVNLMKNLSFLNLFIINQTLGEVSHLSLKQKGHRVFLNYLYDFNSQSIGR